MWFRKKEAKPFLADNAELYVGNLPIEVGVIELCALLNRFGDHFSVKMLHKEYQNGENCRFCIASFDSQRRARKATRKLLKAKRQDSYLEVHEYIHRTYNNERRSLHWRNHKWDTTERRKRERRRKELVKPADDLFAGNTH